ncbi:MULTISPECIES: putative nucleotidyltransferase substrate binding domain-containing protein [unclassified Ruegeria]|uniref:putative nucleotidyltransferase substrate binding domain-containing protein n=1 Tax=unclassified Ruegeria TaxID=2625375 RepID=UPI001AE5C3DB|nr:MULTISPECIES: putative nucleotidyltransferase substrate binding domain-containing protein [unclassified Ruegeria]
MPLSHDEIARFLKSVHPYDALPADALDQIVKQIEVWEVEEDTSVYELGHALPGVFVIYEGQVEITDENGAVVSQLGLRNSFGERGLLKDGKAATKARAHTPSVLIVLPPDLVRELIDGHDVVAKFFDRTRGDRSSPQSLATSSIDILMAPNPATCPADTPVQKAAQIMRDKRISSLCITDGDTLQGIATLRDISGKYVADGLPPSTPISEIMTANPVTLSPGDIGSDVLHIMMERGIGHVPISEGGRLVGIVTQTDLTYYQAVNSAELVRRIAQAHTAEDMARVTAEIPQLLVQLVAGGNRHEIVTRLITDIADTVTRRLLALAEQKLGPPPVPYLWLACGSQGRQEQTGVSDQDNCMMLDDSVTDADMEYFTKLARFVSDGLDTCGYFYCPGDMMATNPRWCQPVRVWRDYFKGWIAKPNPEAQMLASVMFDLRPIGGAFDLFADLQADTLAAARANSIFVAHMISNSLKHTPPLGLLRGFATIRSGEHRNTLDLKHNGVVPVVDLARIYALQGELPEANTRARLKAAEANGVLSASGAHDLLDAYDLIAETRLEHQVQLVKSGKKPDNYLPPSDLSDFERSHLRDAFVVVKTMQSAVGHGKGLLG